MSTKDALVVIFERNAFYKRMHMLAFGALILSIIVIGILISVILFLLRNPTHPLYFATDPVSRLLTIVPVNIPNMSPPDVMSWAEEAVEKSYAVDYLNYHQQLQSAEKYFSNYGWTQFLQGLSASNNLLAIKGRRMIVLAQAIDQPKVITQGLLGGAYAWKFQIPLLVTYWLPPYDNNSKILNPLLVTVILQRQPELQSYKGLSVLQMIGTLAPTPAAQPQEISATPTNS